MSTTTPTTKGGDLSALLGGGPESPVPNPDMPILALRAVAALILGLWYGGQAGHDRLLAWADRAFLAFIKQPDGSWVADRPVQLGGDLIRWFYATAVQDGLAWAALTVLMLLLVELLGVLLLLQRAFSAPSRRMTAAYRLRTLNPANRARFPASLDGGSLWAALIGALDSSADGVCLTLHRTANSTATLGVQLSAPRAPALRPTSPTPPSPAAPPRPRVILRTTGVPQTLGHRPIVPVGYDQIDPPRRTGAAATIAATARVLESTLKQFDETVLLDRVPDPLQAILAPGMTVLTQAYRLRRAPHWPLKAADLIGDTMHALANSLSADLEVIFHEVQFALTPLPNSATRRWYQRGRWYYRRLKRFSALQVTDDFQALNTKLAERHVALTIRLVVVLAAGCDPVRGQQALAVSGTALRALDARYRVPPIGSVKQALIPLGPPQVVPVTAAALAAPTLPRPLAQAATLSAALVCLAILALIVSFATDQWAQWADLSAPIQRGLLALAGLHTALVIIHDSCAATRLGLARILHRQPRPQPHEEQLLLPLSLLTPAPILSSSEAGQLWHLPSQQAQTAFTWLPNRQIAASPTMFVPHGATNWLTLGMARTSGGDLAPVGLPLTALHQMMHITAGMGAGKSQAAASLCHQLLPHGMIIVDGKGDDQVGGLGQVVRRYVPLGDEHRLRFVDVLDTAFPVSLNPVYYRVIAMTAATSKEEAEQHFTAALGIMMGIFERIDPETWQSAPGMKQYALMGCSLVIRAGSAQPGHIPTLAKVGRALRDLDYRATLLERYPFQTTSDLVYEFWTVREPALPETQKTSLAALLRRFDQLLLNPITRSMLTIEVPSVNLLDAMEQGQIVIIPVPHSTMGGLASLVIIFIVQTIIAAAFLRPGNDQSRRTAMVIIDEVQVLLTNGESKDLADAFTQLRSKKVGLLAANQVLSQLGTIDEIIRINTANRLILRTGEPDAGTYARMYANVGLRPEDILGMPALDQQYAVTLGPDRSVQVASIIPNPWPVVEPVTVPRHHGRHWQQIVIHDPIRTTTEAQRAALWQLDQQVATLLYTRWSEADYYRIVGQLVQLPDAEWDFLLARAAAIRARHRQHLLENPGSIRDQVARQTWLTRLIASQGALIEDAIFLRAEQGYQPSAAVMPLAIQRRDAVLSTGQRQGGVPKVRYEEAERDEHTANTESKQGG